MHSLRISFPTEEQRLLTLSAFVMGTIGIAGLIIGGLSGSQAVITDGIFSLIGVVIKLFMLWTARLVAKERSLRFQFGYWQMEPLVLCLEGLFILVVVVYAAWAGAMSLGSGGHAVDFGLAFYYAVLFEALSGSLYWYLRRKNKTLGSNLVRYDTVSWYVDAALAAGLLVSFALAYLLQFTPYASYDRYVDPLIMIALSLHMIHPALHILMPSFRQILGVAPADVHSRVQQVMDEAAERFHFQDYVTSVQQYGDTKIIEIDILISKDYPVSKAEDFDSMRNTIDRALGYPEKQKWVTITFTTTRRWMAKSLSLQN